MTDARSRGGDAETVEIHAEADRDPFECVAEEFVERCRRGESPSVAEYEERFPEHAERIRSLLPAVAVIERLGRGSPQPVEGETSRPMPGKLGDFRIVRELGRGGMGVVYEAVQESLGRIVAVKVVHQVQFDPRRLHRFQREAQAVARLHHTNIVPIFAVGEHDGLAYYAMQYIAGRGLDALIEDWRRDALPRDLERTRFVARIGIQGAEALQYAHDQGILHRDVKPANLLIDEHQSVWITDFGLAKLVGHDDLTRTGDVIGTLRYIAPEALQGQTGPQNDVYSLGLTLYELITLNPPFGDVSPSELLRQVSECQPTRPRKLDPTIPHDLETIILKAIAPEPGHRYLTAGALADDLRSFLEDRPIRARRATVFERIVRWSRRNRTMAGLTATAAAALVLAAIVGVVGYASTRAALRRSDENVALSLAVFGELFDKLSPDQDFFPPPTGRRGRRPSRGAPFERPQMRDDDPDRPQPDGPDFDRERPPDDGRGRRPPPGKSKDQFDRGRRGFPPTDRRANPFAPDDQAPGGAPRPPRLEGAEENTALLQSVLTFYEQFALRNETNLRLEGEAAWAYFKVGSLSARFGRPEEASRAVARAVEMFESLVRRYPGAAQYRSKLVEIAIMTDPWSVDASALVPLERQLRRARELVDQLAAEKPENLDYVQSQIHVHAKLGAVLQRLDRSGEAESSYRRAIEFAGDLMKRSPTPVRATIDRADVREALASLVLVGGARDQARTLLAEAVADLRSLEGTRHISPLLSERYESLAEDFRKLGETEQAETIAGWARARGARP
jgi:predicted Ser/Thr protein kinase/tetratricopeptide (TPR) repeat protein